MKASIFWAKQILKKQGYCLISCFPKKIQDSPWSEVYKFEATEENIFLKKTPPALAIENNVIKLLSDKFHISVPIIIAKNKKENCFLMKNAGISLRSYFKQYGFDQEIFIKTLNDYSAFQYQTINSTENFLKFGVPDWSANKIATLYEEVVHQKDFLSQIGLTLDEINQCHHLIPIFSHICKQLFQYKIPNTFNHCDFHDNNILIDPVTQKTTLIDLGEVEITHPFFSLSNALRQIRSHFQLTEQECETLQEEALKPWLKLESKANVVIIMDLIRQCSLMHHLLSIHRIMKAVDPIAFQTLARERRFANKLRLFL